MFAIFSSMEIQRRPNEQDRDTRHAVVPLLAAVIS
jgi:hypothetical protein